MRSCKAALSLVFLLPALAGCRSRYMAATITNQTPDQISVVQVEYPSASFGTQILAPGQTFQYRFKIQGSGQVKLTYLTSSRKELHFTGPELHEGDEGSIAIALKPEGDPGWDLHLMSH